MKTAMNIRTIVGILAIGLLAGVAGCKSLSDPNFNASDLNQLTSNPTRAAVLDAVPGLLIGHRSYQDGQVGYVSELGMLGRESVVLDIADPRWVSEMLSASLNPGDGAFGGNFWFRPYQNVKLASTILTAMAGLSDAPDQGGMSPAEKAATTGFVETMQALDFLTIVNTHDTNCGCPIETTDDVNTPAPQVDKAAVFAKIESLLGDAIQQLRNGGDSFPFSLSDGFTGFDTPETLLKAVYAIKARVDVYTMQWDVALNDLDSSFVDTTTATVDGLRVGIYDAYGSGSGDNTNGLFQPNDPNIRGQDSLFNDVETQPNGDMDARVLRKTTTIESRKFQGISSGIAFTIYNSLTTPIPIIRNEELILLRAEANIQQGDLEAGRADINFVRRVSGGLDPVGSFADQSAAIDQLLQERRYSLLFEGGHRWIDMRRYDRLDQIAIDPSTAIATAYPLPLEETDARK